MNEKQTLTKKIDFAVIFRVKNANPNGNPLDGNRPRITDQGLGEVSDVCIKRKIRDRLQDAGEAIFVQSDDRRNDAYESLKDRANGEIGDVLKTGKSEAIRNAACAKWIDVRAFGQVLAFKPEKEKKTKGRKAADLDTGEDGGDSVDPTSAKGVSIPIRGPVSVHPAFSTERLVPTSTQITKSVSSEKAGETRSSDTMGMKHRIDKGTYWFVGSISPQLAAVTGFTDADADKIKSVLPRLFENDVSSARPDGSMRVLNVFWWEQPLGTPKPCSSARVHDSLMVATDGTAECAPLDGLKPEVIEGF
jgi:CRISPR-associated protein Csd2